MTGYEGETGMAMLEVKRIRKDYVSGLRTVKALSEVTFKVEEGEFVAIMGPSGAGKSTVLQICAGLLKPTDGTVLYDGNDLFSKGKEELALFRRDHIGYVFQSFNLLPMLTARENIAIPSLLNGSKPDESKLNTIAETLGITERLDHFPSELSGGEQQRVAVARAIINDPSIIFADEPTGNLDSATAADIMAIFVELNKRGKTVIIVTHDNTIASYCTRKIMIADGFIVNSH